MFYSVKYKRVGGVFWKTLKRVKGDGVVEARKGSAIALRYFILEGETRIEIPTDSHIFKFDRGRFEAIKEKLESDAGQSIPVKS